MRLHKIYWTNIHRDQEMHLVVAEDEDSAKELLLELYPTAHIDDVIIYSLVSERVIP